MESIENQTFSYCTGLSSITIPENITRIGIFAFMGCNGLKSVTIPKSVTYLDNGVFYMCENLETVTIGSCVTQMGNIMFIGCGKLREVNSLNSIPPTFVGAVEAFNENVYQQAVLNVPTGSTSAYQSADFWKNFTSVNGKDFTSDIHQTTLKENVFETGNGIIRFTNGGWITIYSINGNTVYKGLSKAGETVSLAPGVYIIHTNGASQKVIL